MSTIELPPMSLHDDGPRPGPSHPYRLTLDQYRRLVDAGILDGRKRVYLWDGILVEKMTKNPPHVIAQGSLLDETKALVPRGWYVGQDQPIEFPGANIPEPDLTIVRGRSRDYPDRPPLAADVALVAEVSDSSLRFDQGEMLRAYAASAIPVYWIVNIPDARIEVHTDPTGPAELPTYRKVEHHVAGQVVPLVLDGREVGRIAVADILP